MLRLTLTTGACAIAIAFAAPVVAQEHDHAGAHSPATHAALTTALAHPSRAKDRARDAWRHPAETLTFFKVEPGMTVVDYMPSGGWFTRVLVPYLGDNGRYIGLNPDVATGSPQMKQYFGNLAEKFPTQAAGWTGVPVERIAAYNTDGLPKTLDGTVDRVMIMREMHNLWRMGMMHRELTAIRRLLKPSGMLGIEQHRAKADASADYTDGSKGYLREKDVIALVEAHGFELVARSEVNANPKDPANWPDGVWTLPPNARGSDKDAALKAKVDAVGESDRMTLLFRKRA
jgi:predicted methyltransferase